MLDSDPGFRVYEVGDMARLVTGEGEYGAWTRLDGMREGRPTVRFVGAVLADELATVLDVIAMVPARVAEVERLSIDLLRQEVLYLSARPRRFFYIQPTGWQAVPSGVTANWYPLDFPSNRSMIVVPVAMPRTLSPDGEREQVFAQTESGLEIAQLAREELTSSTGAVGTCLRVHGRRHGDSIYREAVVFVVDDRVYRFRLETTMVARILELGETLRGVAGSFKPLPTTLEIRAGIPFVPPADKVLDYWTS